MDLVLRRTSSKTLSRTEEDSLEEEGEILYFQKPLKIDLLTTSHLNNERDGPMFKKGRVSVSWQRW